MVMNIGVNLLILACFKYFNFFADSIQTLALSAGISLDLPTLRLALPVGISFYTFQSLSYTIDVYRGKMRATYDSAAFFAYISFFPQLVAGPIERATNLLPQMLCPRKFDYSQGVDGLRQILCGFFKKMVVADNCAIAVNLIWDNMHEHSALTLVLGMVLFSFQIYGDFSGYSDIAIGTARLFGIRLSDNFRLPYFSRSVAEFWRRWHISLMSWFRDYVYIPLGGSRCSRLKRCRNTFVVFLLSGLWHGANWTFVLWGGYCALLFVPQLLSGKSNKERNPVPAWTDIPRIILTFILITVGWVLFRADTAVLAFSYFEAVAFSLAKGSALAISVGKVALLWCVVLIVMEWLQRDKRHILQFHSLPSFARLAVYYVMLFAIVFFHGEEQTFIYFQF